MFTEEELKELQALEDEFASADKEAFVSSQRTHLDALRMRKKHAKLGSHGLDYLVIETRAGAFAFRQPSDVELDALLNNASSREAHESYLGATIIDPDKFTAQAKFVKYPGLVDHLVTKLLKELIKSIEIEQEKK